jgi:hypothetical protein
LPPIMNAAIIPMKSIKPIILQLFATDLQLKVSAHFDLSY